MGPYAVVQTGLMVMESLYVSLLHLSQEIVGQEHLVAQMLSAPTKVIRPVLPARARQGSKEMGELVTC